MKNIFFKNVIIVNLWKKIYNKIVTLYIITY